MRWYIEISSSYEKPLKNADPLDLAKILVETYFSFDASGKRPREKATKAN